MTLLLSFPLFEHQAIIVRTMLHFFQPQQIDGSLGRGYNYYMGLIPSDDHWAVLQDYDTMFLYHPEELIKRAIKEYPDTGMFTCYTNRIGNPSQLLNGKISPQRDILAHHDLASRVHNLKLWECTELMEPVSGFCMIIKKSTWKQLRFNEDQKLLGVDTDFSRLLLSRGKKIRRINGLYMFHFYRMNKSVRDKSHLQS